MGTSHTERHSVEADQNRVMQNNNSSNNNINNNNKVDEAMRELFGARGGAILLRMQRAVISHTLNIARTLKVMS